MFHALYAFIFHSLDLISATESIEKKKIAIKHSIIIIIIIFIFIFIPSVGVPEGGKN